MKEIKRVVVKVGTSTLTYNNGTPNIKRIEQIVRVLSDLKNSGKEIILVTSGAIGVGTSKLGLGERPWETRVKQAAAAVGQCELMSLYSKLFIEYGHVVGQILMTRIITDRDNTKRNLINTFDTLLSLGVIPIVNENDSVSVKEIECDDIAFGGNDILSAIVAALINADILIMMSDKEGFLTGDPHSCAGAELIPVVYEITDDLRAIAGGAGTEHGTGGMFTKLEAAEIANNAGVDMVIMDGACPEKLYDLFDGKPIGTIFCAKKESL
jgi:glutamate 5-kinase